MSTVPVTITWIRMGRKSRLLSPCITTCFPCVDVACILHLSPRRRLASAENIVHGAQSIADGGQTGPHVACS
jgi:hypothetical protein